MTALWLLLACLLDDAPKFTDIAIDKPFAQYLLANPVLMEVSGAKVIRLPNGQRAVIAVGSAVLTDKSAEDRLRAEKVCRAKALASLVAEKEGVQVAHTEQVEETTTVVLDGAKETTKSVATVLQITRLRVRGLARDLPVIGRWKSKSGDTLYLAIGAICDQRGNPVAVKPAR